MKIAYLVNQYPSVSHTFIRREILALEQLDFDIERLTIRKSLAKLCDPKDIAELDRTHVILSQSLFSIFLAFLKTILTRPIRVLSTCRTALTLSSNDSKGLLKYLFYLVESCVVLQWAKKRGIEHVHVHFGTNPTTVALLCKLLGGPNYSFTIHGPEEFDAPIGLSLPKKIQEAQFVVAITSYCRSQIMRWCDHSSWDKIHEIHCTVDQSFLSSSSEINSTSNSFVCVGRLSEQKGQLLILDALKKIVRKGINAKVVFAGDGEMRNVLEKRISELNLQNHTAITGWISGDQVREEIVKSRALLLPSFAEGLPVVIMEAFALNRPVITTFVAGIPELVDETCGILVPAGSCNAIIEAMEQILALTQRELSEMGEVGASRVQSRHHDITEAKKLATLFKKMRS